MKLHHIFVQDADASNLELHGEATIHVTKLADFMDPGVVVAVLDGDREQTAVIDAITQIASGRGYRYKVMLKRVEA